MALFRLGQRLNIGPDGPHCVLIQAFLPGRHTPVGTVTHPGNKVLVIPLRQLPQVRRQPARHGTNTMATGTVAGIGAFAHFHGFTVVLTQLISFTEWILHTHFVAKRRQVTRSEERRVGKECRSRWWWAQ